VNRPRSPLGRLEGLGGSVDWSGTPSMLGRGGLGLRSEVAVRCTDHLDSGQSSVFLLQLKWDSGSLIGPAPLLTPLSQVWAHQHRHPSNPPQQQQQESKHLFVLLTSTMLDCFCRNDFTHAVSTMRWRPRLVRVPGPDRHALRQDISQRHHSPRGTRRRAPPLMCT
jgi:hypothetical protein